MNESRANQQLLTQSKAQVKGSHPLSGKNKAPSEFLDPADLKSERLIGCRETTDTVKLM